MKKDAVKGIIIALFFFSGFTSLLYQVVWLKMLTLVFGNTAYAVSTLLAAFMAGLALGSYLFGRIADRIISPVRLYGFLEGLIGIFALTSPWIFKGIEPLYVYFYRASGASGFSFSIFQFILCFFTLLLPTTLMGGTLPLMVRHFIRNYESVGFKTGYLYAINTFGAVAGTFVTGFILILAFGLKVSIFMGSIANYLIFIVAFVLSRKPGAAMDTLKEAPVINGKLKPALAAEDYQLLFLFFLSGAAALAYEVLWTRILLLHLGSSVYAYSLMLTIFLIGLTLGSFLFGHLVDRIKNCALLFAFLEAGIGFYLLIQLGQFGHLSELMGNLSELMGTPSYAKKILISFMAAGQVLLIPTLFMGAIFPVIVKLYSQKIKNIGRDIGRLYSANTVGCIIGSLAAGFLLIPWVGVQRSLLIIATVNLLIGIYILLMYQRKRFVFSLISASILLIFFCAYYFVYDKDSIILKAGVFNPAEGRKVLYYSEDVYATVTVEEINEVRGKWLSLSMNGVNVAGTSADLVCIQKMQGHLPLLLHPNPEKVLHIGFGSGGTAWAVSNHPVKEIVIAEISRGVTEAADKYFKGVNHSILRDPRVKVTYCDGRNFLLTSKEKFDVILNDSIHPRYAGNGSLYTYDYYKLCRSRLKENGIISQWLPLYSLSEDNFKMILKSFQRVFPHTSVWYINSTINSFTIVIGQLGNEGISLQQMKDRLSNPEVKSDLQKIGANTPYKILDYFMFHDEDVRKFVGQVPLHTDDHPYIEYLASKIINREYSWYLNLEDIVKNRTSAINLLNDTDKDNQEYSAVSEKMNIYAKATEHNLQGQLYFLQGNYNKMKEEFNKIPSINPEDLEPFEYFSHGIFK
jgi:spermidine synthase